MQENFRNPEQKKDCIRVQEFKYKRKTYLF